VGRSAAFAFTRSQFCSSVRSPSPQNKIEKLTELEKKNIESRESGLFTFGSFEAFELSTLLTAYYSASPLSSVYN